MALPWEASGPECVRSQEWCVHGLRLGGEGDEGPQVTILQRGRLHGKGWERRLCGCVFQHLHAWMLTPRSSRLPHCHEQVSTQQLTPRLLCTVTGG
eukprot:12423191-Karenia_brevis.AAC.1